MVNNKLIADIEHAQKQIAFDSPLDQIAALQAARDMIDWYIERAVGESRQGIFQEIIDDHEEADGSTATRSQTVRIPASWNRIGDALGITRQAAWRRFRHIT